MKESNILYAAAAVLGGILIVPTIADACSRMAWTTEKLGVFSARSMDWAHTFDDVLFINPRGRKMNGGGAKNTLEWTSKHGNVVASIYPFAKTRALGWRTAPPTGSMRRD